MPLARSRNQRFGVASLLMALGLAVAAPAAGAPIDTGSDVALRWDTTVWLTTLLQPGRATLNLRNYCDGTAGRQSDCTYQGVRQGRLDVATSLDLSMQWFSARAGAIAWYDAVDRPDHHDLRGVEIDTSAHGGQAVEVYEAFLRGEFDLAGGRLSVRAGRQSLIWGETLFFTSNGIAAAQAPVDTYRPQTRGGYSGTDAFLPVNQISVNWQPAGGWSVEAYAQLEWRRSRIDPHDAYASASDILGAEGNRAFGLDASNGATPIYTRIGDRRPRDVGAFGFALRGHVADLDVGLYAIRYNATTPTVLIQPGRDGPRTYQLDYKRDIELYGLSVAGPLGDAEFGFELSARRNAPLVNGGVVVPNGSNLATVARDEVEPIGDSLHAQFSWMQKLSPSSLLVGGADWSGEIAANQLLDRNDAARRQPARTRFAASVRTVLAPHIFQVLPHLDLSLPISVGYNFVGLSSLDPAMNRGTGDISIGIRADFQQAWKAELTLTHYFGRAKNADTVFGGGGALQPLSNWDSIQITLQRSF
ncbi:MAG: hypothetical protein JWM77_3356 [Rhodospirillales bacterium]|nr:hypothetical protein [Rhodospirillales bacterium]